MTAGKLRSEPGVSKPTGAGGSPLASLGSHTGIDADPGSGGAEGAPGTGQIMKKNQEDQGERKAKQTRFFTREEVKRHNRKGDCWLVVGGKVYDATHWVERHPGGELLILNVAGLDATDPVRINHSPWVLEKLLPRYQIGVLGEDAHDGQEAAESESELTRDYREMIEDFKKAGMFDTDYAYYGKLWVWYLLLLSLAVGCVTSGPSPLVRVGIGGLVMGLYFQQVAFFGHDLGHNGVTHDRSKDLLLGALFGNFLTGISLGWWKATHNVHHLVTNSVAYDPDIQHLPVFAVTPAFFKDVFSKYHFFVFPFQTSRVAQWFVRHQHYCYHLIMGVARFNLYVQGFLLLLSPRKESRRRGVERPFLEITLLLGFWSWFSCLLAQLATGWEMLGFLLLSHMVAGLLHVQITISHFPMETYEGDEVPLAQEKEYVVAQLLTTMDVDCPAWMDWFHGGLQFQVVHHLMPRMPRHNLRKASEMVKSLARKHGLVYKVVGFWEANRMVLQTLRKTARQVHPFLVEGLNAAG